MAENKNISSEDSLKVLEISENIISQTSLPLNTHKFINEGFNIIREKLKTLEGNKKTVKELEKVKAN